MSRVKHSKKFTIDQSTELLFPLFSAEGEKLWVPGWDYENIMGPTDLHEDYIFLTKTHDHASSNAIWLVKRYEPDTHFVQFYKIEPEEKIGIITIQCTPVKDNLTEVEVTYEYVGLSEKGNAFIEGFTSVHYEKFINEWENLLITYFQSKG